MYHLFKKKGEAVYRLTEWIEKAGLKASTTRLCSYGRSAIIPSSLKKLKVQLTLHISQTNCCIESLENLSFWIVCYQS